MTSNGDDLPDSDESASAGDAIATGAAADSSENDRFTGLPRILRYAMLVAEGADHVEERLLAEIDQLCSGLPESIAWAASHDSDTGLELAAELDRRAVTQDEPILRSLADCVRMVCLPLPSKATYFDAYRRVGRVLVQAFRKYEDKCDDDLCCKIESFVVGWAALPVYADFMWKQSRAALNAAIIGFQSAQRRLAAAETKSLQRSKKDESTDEASFGATTSAASNSSLAAAETVLSGRLVVARMSDNQLKSLRLKEIIGPLKGAINTALPLVKVPPLQEVRRKLLFEFPYAAEVIDFALADLVGRSTVHLRPLMLVGAPGGGKTFFARRLSEALLDNRPIWRTDASRADGATFGGTDRRWHSAEPCHPFLAIVQAKAACAVCLIDEIEKAASGSEHGRLWDALLGFLESETSSRYPDPALQVDLDLSHVSYIATANSIDPLPYPLRDRFRIVRFPQPTADDLDALLPAVITSLASERGIDESWIAPLDRFERDAVAQHWSGGSVRRLQRLVEAVLRARESRAVCH